MELNKQVQKAKGRLFVTAPGENRHPSLTQSSTVWRKVIPGEKVTFPAESSLARCIYLSEPSADNSASVAPIVSPRVDRNDLTWRANLYEANLARLGG